MRLSNHFLSLLLLAVTIHSFIIADPPIKALIQHVLSHPQCHQALLASLRQHYSHLSHAPQADAKLNQMAPILITAIEHLHEVPGFANKLHIILQTLHLETSGEFYEIEKALQIVQNPKNVHAFETIENMNPIIKLSQESGATYYDLLTPYRFIECKNINWNDNPKENSPGTCKLRAQFLRQQKTVFLINQNHNTSYLYQVHSKRKVPEPWMKWFEESGISIVEQKN